MGDMGAFTTFIVICQQVVCSPVMRFETVYNWDGKAFDSRESAISHGFKIRDSDDFNIGILKSGRLEDFCWMENSLCEERDVLSEIARQIGVGS
jgi:hypothetical protein